MRRLNLAIDDATGARLEEQANRESRSLTEIIRRALDMYFAEADRKTTGSES